MTAVLKSPFDVKAPPKKEFNKLIPGSLIRVRGEEWQVIRKRKFIENDPTSHFEIEAEGLTGIVVGYRSVFLSNIDTIELIAPEDITLKVDNSKGFRKTKLYLEALLRNLPIRNDDKICVGHKGVFDSKAYQLQPALKALQQIRPRILIGDGVGLGKTIEIGILLSELIKRGKGKRILVVTPKAIISQFQKEIFTRFGIALTRLDSQGILSLNRMLPSTVNPFMFHDRVIVSMDTLKNDQYLTKLEKCHWDTIVIDECHNVSIKGGNTKNQRAKLARVLCDQAEAVILASATPHDGTMEGFASLVKLLDPTAIKDETNYSYEEIKHLFIRRTKDTVKDELRDGHLRENILKNFSLSSEEEEVLESLNTLKLEEDVSTQSKKRIKGAGYKELFKTTLIKSFLSSPNALIETIQNKIDKNKNISVNDKNELEKIQSLAQKTTDKKFTKFKELDDMLSALPKDKKAVIFTERIATLTFLEQKLSKYGEVLKMDGGMPDTDLMSVAARFQSTKDKARILVATNVASEGLNLHHACHHLVHFDLPWSFITLEQRNGRIDRIGQKFAPHLYYMCGETKNPKLKADLHITEKLAARIKKAGSSMDDASLESGFLTGEQEVEQMTLEFEEGQFGLKSEKEESADDYLSQFLMPPKEATSEGNYKQQYQDSIKNLESFYNSDFDFTKEALSILDLDHEAKADEIIVPLDRSLRFELDEAPKEVLRGEHLKLQFNATKMQKEISESISANEWPTSQWASDFHPLLQLLRTRCLELFPGDQTPVVFYKGESDNHKMGFLMQGILYNKHGQILFEEWSVCTFDNLFKKEALPYGPFKISQIKEWTGLGGKNVVNPNEDLNQRLEKTILERAVLSSEWMKGVMEELRDQRGKSKLPKVRSEASRLEIWGRERRAALSKHLETLKLEKSIGANLRKSEIEGEIEEINCTISEYSDWVNDYYASSKNPVIKIVGVFINAGKK